MQLFQLAIIDENQCIGCTKCIQICPFDAIVGAAKQLHTILETECTGCGLCLPPCPVDCISLVSVETPRFDWACARARRRARRERLQKEGRQDQKMELTRETFAALPVDKTLAKNEIAAALMRVKNKSKKTGNLK